MNLKKLNCSAVSAFRLEGDDLLTTSYTLEIKNGVVVGFEKLTPPNVPSASIGKAVKKLWGCIRSQKIEND